MAARRIAQETFDAVLQEKANRYMDPSGETVGETLQFKAQGKLKYVVLGGVTWVGGACI